MPAPAGHETPLHAPFGLSFLPAVPAAGLAAALRRLEPATRTVLAVADAGAVDVLVAEATVGAARVVSTGRGGGRRRPLRAARAVSRVSHGKKQHI
ncbi:hypothetical protein ACF1G0_09165 [Streptomyces sp. NPDC013953]|uniref:hypothetical protein n=1 Tax=Streptomyces sp. NPDC013953 TaxID=3364868 RepID=UPI0036F72D5E